MGWRRMQAAKCDRVNTTKGVGLLPCPPIQRLTVTAGCITITESIDASKIDREYPRSSAAAREQLAGREPFWQKIILRPSDGIEVVGRGALPLRVLLDSHPAEQLVVQVTNSTTD